MKYAIEINLVFLILINSGNSQNVPLQFNYQGKILDSAGEVLSPAPGSNQLLTFSIWNSEVVGEGQIVVVCMLVPDRVPHHELAGARIPDDRSTHMRTGSLPGVFPFN